MIFFFFNDTATTEIYTLSLHDALPICFPAPSPRCGSSREHTSSSSDCTACRSRAAHSRALIGWGSAAGGGSEEHTSELQSRQYLVCRLLLEKKKQHVVALHPQSHRLLE